MIFDLTSLNSSVTFSPYAINNLSYPQIFNVYPHLGLFKLADSDAVQVQTNYVPHQRYLEWKSSRGDYYYTVFQKKEYFRFQNFRGFRDIFLSLTFS